MGAPLSPEDRNTLPIRVLYLHPFGVYGGATKSLAEMFASMPSEQVVGTALAPRGVAARSLEAAGIRVLPVPGIPQFDDTRYGHYRGLRWLILLREFLYWPPILIALWRLRKTSTIDLIHSNEITAMLPGLLAKRWLDAPLVVHVRSLQRGAQGSRVTRGLMDILSRHVDAVVAIDMAVRRTLPNDLPVTVVHNGLRITNDVVTPRASSSDVFTLAVIGVLHRFKGLFELLEAISLIKKRGLKVQLLIVGENSRNPKGISGWILRQLDFAHDTRSELEALVSALEISDCVTFTGFISDIQRIYCSIDALCFPSHLDAPGRPVLEAALFGLPSIVAMRNPTDDVIQHGKTGLCIESPTPEAIADAIQVLVSDRGRCRKMGEEAKKLAGMRFDSRITAARMLDVYCSLSCRTNPISRKNT